MAGTTQRAGARRRHDERRAEARRERIILIAVGVTLAIALVVVAVGLFITQYLPPRAHVTTIDGRDYDAAAVARRAGHFLLFDAQGRQDVDVTAEALTRLEREELLRKRAPAVVGEVSDEDVEKYLRERLGFAGENVDANAFAESLRQQLRLSGLRQSEHRELTRATVLEQRLRDRFRDEVPKSAPQVHLARVRVNSEAAAQRVREQAATGTDFARLVTEQSVDTATRPRGGDLGWQLNDALDPGVRTAVAGLPTGAISDVVRVGNQFDVYRVVELQPEREVSDQQRTELARKRVDEWVERERASFPVERDLSGGEAEWIQERARDHFSSAATRLD